MSWFTGLLGAVVGGIIGFFIGGPQGAFIGASIGFSLGMAIDPIAPDVKSPGMAVEPLQITSNIIGTPIIDLLGTSRITGFLLAFGLERTVPVYVKVKQGKKTVKQLKGYYYYASWQLGICFGPTDTLYTIFRNDDEVIWEGTLNRPVSGGVETILPTGVGTKGVVRFYFGTDDQPADATVATLIGDATLNSPLRGLCYAVFDNCYLGTYNRMPTMSFVVRRTPAIAFSTKHVIQAYDYNPMHAIWYMLTTLGGLPTAWLNTLDFAAVASVLDGERRGISARLSQPRSLETYIETINAHIDGILRYGSDGAFHPKLIRNDYTPADLEVIDETVLLDKPEFSRGSWIGTVNEVKAQYSEITDRLSGSDPYLIGWYKFDEGSGLIVANSATGGGSGGGLLPNLNVVDNNGDFWTYLPGYATSQKAGEVAFNNSYAWVSLPATRTFGHTACYGIFFKRRLDATIYHYMAICAFNKNNTPYEDLFSIYFMPWISTAQKYDFRSNWMGSTVGTPDLSLDNGLWYFSFIDNTGRCHIVFPNGTKLSTAPSSFASLDLNFLHAGLRASAGNGGFYTVQCSYGDWIIYNNKGLTVDEWVVWYDQLRSRYGMAARSGW